MSKFQKFRLFFGLYSKNIATFQELEAFRGNNRQQLPHHHSIHNVLLLGRCPAEVDTCRFNALVPHQVCKESNVVVPLKKILCVAVAKRMRVHDLGIHLVFGCVVFQLLGNASCGNPLPESVQKQIPAASSRSFQPFKRFLSKSLGNE